jgi:GMP synthase-like glutamine amidotransferase
MIIDPAVKKPELRTLNGLAHQSPLPMTYHLPALFGVDSVLKEEKDVAGILILGSLSSVNDRHSWQNALESWLMPRLEAGVPTLGICYGHQMLAHMFGAKVTHAFNGEKRQGFREVCLEPNPLWGNQTLKGPLCVSHEEAVVSAPSGFKVVGQSKDVAIDALAHETLPVWGFQSHPEATEFFLLDRGQKGPWDPALFKFGNQLICHFLKWVSEKK